MGAPEITIWTAGNIAWYTASYTVAHNVSGSVLIQCIAELLFEEKKYSIDKIALMLTRWETLAGRNDKI